MVTKTFTRDSSKDIILDTTKYISQLSDGTNTYVIKDTEARTSITNKQDTLISGTNIKTVGGTTLLGSGNIAFPTVDQTYSSSSTSTNALSHKAIADSKFLQNKYSGSTNGLVIEGNQTSVNGPTSVGNSSNVTGHYGTAVGYLAQVSGNRSVAIGYQANCNNAEDAIQLGCGTNTESNSFYVAPSVLHNYKMLGSDGKIPDDRLSSNIARTSNIPTVDQTYSGSSTNAQSGVAVKSAIDAAISSVYKPGGSVTFSSLPTPSSDKLGYVYNVNNSFTTNGRFIEGAGKNYPAGTNVVIVEYEYPTTTTYYAYSTGDSGENYYTTTYPPIAGDTLYYGMIPYDPRTFTVRGTVISYDSSTTCITYSYEHQGEIRQSTTGSRKSGHDIIQTGIDYFFDVLSGFIDLSGYQTIIDSSNKLNADLISDGTTNKTVTVTEKSTWSGKQDQLVSGTNIKTVNNESILGSGNINIQGGSSYTAGTGIDITNDVISVTSPTLTNTATGSNGLTILGNNGGYNGVINIGGGTSAYSWSVAIGLNAKALGSQSTSLGYASHIGANGTNSVAIGANAKVGYASGGIEYAIQLGYGINEESNSFYVGTSSSNNWKMLGSDGTIPNARLNVMTGADGTNAGTKGAVPAPTATDNTKFLRGDGTWAAVSGGGSDVEEYSIAEIEALWDGESE